jgi:hypothetical protein
MWTACMLREYPVDDDVNLLHVKRSLSIMRSGSHLYSVLYMLKMHRIMMRSKMLHQRLNSLYSLRTGIRRRLGQGLSQTLGL